MVKFLRIVWILCLVGTARAELEIVIEGGVVDATPIAVVPFEPVAGITVPENLGAIVAADLGRSGLFKPLPPGDMLNRPSSPGQVDFRDWRVLNQDNLVIGRVEANGPNAYLVWFQLFDVYRGQQLANYRIPTTARDLRATAHRIADIVFEKLTGRPGAFDTRVAYVVETGKGDNKRVRLQVADADGHRPQTVVTSKEPIMSPAWAPDGQRLAYVSFEGGRPGIYVQDVATGSRQKVAAFKGINGAPAWSPDGKSLAMTLSKDGNPDIFVMNLATRRLRALTRHWAIDTEPSWSPDGSEIVFTSDRGGQPQIYKMSANGGDARRVTFEGQYNARASYAPDGRSLTLVTRDNGSYKIGVLDFDNGGLRTLSNGKLDESPSFAPNGGMIIYATNAGGRGALAAVSVDGRVRQRLGEQRGNVREPVWSPFSNR